MKKRRVVTKISGDEDRLSALPDGVLCYILSFLDIRNVVELCVSSKRFQNLWSSLPCLNFESSSFILLQNFDKFVNRILTLCDSSMRVDGFSFIRRGTVRSYMFDKVMNYAMSHGVITFSIRITNNNFDRFPECGYDSKSLRIFKLDIPAELRMPFLFPELRIMHLRRVSFTRSDIFSSCPNLTDLSLVDCTSHRLDKLNIDASQLTKLTINSGYYGSRLLACKVEVSAPRLSLFCYRGSHYLLLSISGELSDLEVVSIDVYSRRYGITLEEKEKNASDLVNMFRLFHNAKYLMLSLGTVEVLYEFPDLLANELSPFGNVKSFKFKTSSWYSSTVIPARVMTYLFNNSPCADFSVEWPWCERYPKHKWCNQCPQLGRMQPFKPHLSRET